MALMAFAEAKAAEPGGFELRKRSTIGQLGLVKAQLTTKAEADGTVVVSFQAPEAGTYFIIYTRGPYTGKAAAIVRANKAGPVATRVRLNRR